MRRLRAPLLTLLFVLSGCADLLFDVTNGTDGLHARRSDFQAGTTRHPESYDEVLAGLVSCAEHYSGRMILTNVDLTVRGGFYLTSANYSRYVFYPNGEQQPHIEFGGTMWRGRMYVEHEFAHALAHDFAFLRNPLDTLGVQGAYDHHGPFFAACVKYNPDID